MKLFYSMVILLAGFLALAPGLATAQTSGQTGTQPAPQPPPLDAITQACLGDPSPDNRLAACAKVLAQHPANPDYSWAYNTRGNAYFQKNDLTNAIKEYDAAIKLNPKDPQAYNNRGAVHFRQGQFAPAALDYTAALKADPKDAAAYNNRALANFQLGKVDLASELASMCCR